MWVGDPKIYERKTSDVIYVYKGRKKESVNPFSLWYDCTTNDNHSIFPNTIATFTGATSSIYGIYHNPKEYIIEQFPQDTPKYVALRDLFLSQDKDITSTTDYKQPYESLYDFGFAIDYRYLHRLLNIIRQIQYYSLSNYR